MSPSQSDRPTRAEASRFDEQSADDSGPTGTLRDSSSHGSKRKVTGRVAPQAGETFAGFTIGERIGRGAMGLVYRARDAADRDVALKIILGHQADSDGVARFVREGQAMAAIPAHPNVVRVLSAGKERGLPWLAMDFVEGISLKQRIKRGPLPVEEARLIAHRLAEALAHIHASGVVHRDLKPANVMLRASDGEPLLTDFGLARIQGAQRLTLSGDVIGTPVYMSPEQILGLKHEIDAQTDVWALGVVLYEMLAGQPPFVGANLTEMAALITTTEPRPIRSVRGEVDHDLANAVNIALCKPKPHRFPDAAAFAAALGAVPDRADSDTAPPRSRSRTASFSSGVSLPRARKQAVRIGIGLAVVAGLVLGVGALVRSRMQNSNVEALQSELAALDDAVNPSAKVLPGLLTETADPKQIERVSAELEALRAKSAAAEVPLEFGKVEAALRRGRLIMALAKKDWPAADEQAGAVQDGGERSVLRARVALARGAKVDEAALQALKNAKRADLAEAARVVLARATVQRDPREALLLLKARVRRGLAEVERRPARLLQAIDAGKPEVVGELAPQVSAPLRRAAWRRGFARLRTLLRPGARPEPATAALNALAHLAADADPKLRDGAGPSDGLEVAWRGMQQLSALERQLGGNLSHMRTGERKVALTPLVDLLVALGRSGLRLPWPRRADTSQDTKLTLVNDLTQKLFYLSRVHVSPRQYAEMLLAFVRLDVPVEPRTMEFAAAGALKQLPDGTHKSYLLTARKLTQNSRYSSPVRKQLNAMREQRADLGRHHRAFLLANASLYTDLPSTEQLSMARQALELDPNLVDAQRALLVALARSAVPEHRQELLPMLARQEELPRDEVPLRTQRALAFCYAYLGDRKRAGQWLARIESTDRRFTSEAWIRAVKADVLAILRGTRKKAKD